MDEQTQVSGFTLCSLSHSLFSTVCLLLPLILHYLPAPFQQTELLTQEKHTAI